MRDEAATDLAGLLGEPVSHMEQLRGGDVSDAFRVVLSGGGMVFAKTHRRPSPGAFATEVAGLAWLREAKALPVPAVVAVRDAAGREAAWLVLEASSLL